MSEESRKMAKLAVEALEDKKAEDIKVIDISNVSVIADYFIIAGGNNSSQIQALCDNVEEKLGRAGFPARQTEGYETANWVLLDFGDVIVHVFDKENRLLYDLERIWRDGVQIPVEATTSKRKSPISPQFTAPIIAMGRAVPSKYLFPIKSPYPVCMKFAAAKSIQTFF